MGDKPPLPSLNQQSLQTTPVVKTPQAVWTFLKSQDNFEEDWKEDYTNWLDLIQKRKIQKTFRDNKVSAVVDLTLLWDVEKTSEYSNLTSEVKKTLTDLSQLSYKTVASWKYKSIINFSFQFFSFWKEKYGAVYGLINVLKFNNRWNNLKKYQIKKINDVDIESLLNVQNIASLSDDKETYETFSDSVKASLRNLLNLDVNSSHNFASFSVIFNSSDSRKKILKALGRRIDNVIFKAKVSNLWEFLKTSNHLTNIKQRKISQIGNVDISSLHAADATTTYESLSTAIKDTLFSLIKIANYKIKINTDIENDRTNQIFWDNVLKQNTRFIDLQIYQINTINDTNLTLLLKNTTILTPYADLTLEQRVILKDIKSHQSAIDNQISSRQSNASDAWTFLKTENRLTNLKKYEIKIINGVALLPLFENVALTTEYANLSNAQKTKLYLLSKISNYQKTINDLIKKDKNSETAWTFLTNDDRLKNLKQYQIKIIDGITILPNLASDETLNPYTDLSSSDKTLLYTLSQRPDYQKKVKDAIQTAQTAASSAWTFLTTKNRLVDLKENKINKISDVTLLSFLKDVDAKTAYANLSSKQKTTLYLLSQTINYKQIVISEINKKIKPQPKSKPTTVKPKNISLPDVWKFLQSNNRLKQLQANQTLKTNKFDLSILAKIKPNTKYETLTNEQTTALYDLSQLENYQDIVTKTIANPPKPKTKDSDNLLWLWITLPLFLVSLIFGLGFYFYRKKLSISKLKKPKK